MLLASVLLGQEPVAVRGKVVEISDGDTLTALLADQRLIKVRVAFCDSPELHQAFGSRAKQAMSELVFGVLGSSVAPPWE